MLEQKMFLLWLIKARIFDCDSLSPALFNLPFSSDTTILSMVAFCPLGNSDHGGAWVSIDCAE